MTRSAPGTSALEHAADRAPRHSVQRLVRNSRTVVTLLSPFPFHLNRLVYTTCFDQTHTDLIADAQIPPEPGQILLQSAAPIAQCADAKSCLPIPGVVPLDIVGARHPIGDQREYSAVLQPNGGNSLSVHFDLISDHTLQALAVAERLAHRWQPIPNSRTVRRRSRAAIR